MKQLIALCTAVMCIILCINTADAASVQVPTSRTYKGDVQTVRIPKGTNLELRLIDTISTKTGMAGDEFNAVLIKDQLVNSMVVLPAGSLFRGTLSKIVPSKRLSKSAIVYLNFDHVVTLSGRQIPVTAVLLNYPTTTLDGGLYEGGNYGWAVQQNWKKTKEITSNAIEWGKNTGDNLQYVFTPVGAVGGAIGGGAYFVGDSVIDLFRLGNEVNIPQDSVINVMLLQPLDLPKY